MKKKRRTSEQVTDDMFDKLYEQGNIDLIASNDPRDLCSCDEGTCRCGNDEDIEDLYDIKIYRSKKDPSLCFYYGISYVSLDDGETFRFKFEDIENFIYGDVKFTPAFLMQERKAKIDMVLNHPPNC
ncbi:hypothetical protein [Rufibacter ruber]|uniref:hypothetical protein n=1 Tax=Rufibacter ruber TaxID=1783499 RepID=UPI000830ABF3|nr:hypothetical protein [Rufibacter ruber]